MEGKFQSSGQHLKPYVITNFLQPVMSGAMDACFMSFGALVTSHSPALRIVRYFFASIVYTSYIRYIHQVVEVLQTGYRLSPPTGCPRAIYEQMMKCW